MNASYSSHITNKPQEMSTGESSQGVIQPMGWRPSLLYFSVPAILSILANYVATPILVTGGIKPFYAQFIPDTIVLASLLIASIVAYRLEDRPLIWAGLKNRFRLDRMTGRKWFWVLGGTIAGFALFYLFGPLGTWLIERGLIPLPVSIPAWIDPRVTMSLVEKFNLEAGGLRGNWLVFILATTTFFFNIFGEEFWWRGYILPRQELAFGKWTWLIHAVMWSVIFHAWKYWDLIGLLPAQLVFVFVASRTKSTTVAILLHFLTNMSFPLFVLLGALGVVI